MNHQIKRSGIDYMNKVAIVTLTGYFNFGNRLQNYALSKVLKKLGYEPYTVWNRKLSKVIKEKIKSKLFFIKKYNRFRIFYKFSKNNMKEISLSDIQKYEISRIVVGSDQVWNPKYYDEDNNLLYNPKNGQKVISYAASMGTSKIDNKYIDIYKEILNKYDSISVREKDAEENIKRITGRKDVVTLIDPTLLLTKREWEDIEIKPKGFDNNKKYILNYFLGEISKEEKENIEKYAKENDCVIVNILNKNDNFYLSGPEEFIYILNHSYIICTDSFHACVFSFIFGKPFIVFKRKGCSDYMYSRIENLINTFQLKDREYNGSITNDILKYDYLVGYKKLAEERAKSLEYLQKL